ncbi:receptor-like protein 3 [Malus domestica]|uniref:receptor-like protein 3 n=1 Tax=Malus domestica TaxID=3750 RepID=UPI0039767424
MDLSSNHCHGPIPSSFFQQAWNLTSFNVSNNTFFGYIPSSICLRSPHSVRLLDFPSNEFSGNSSHGFSGCFKLQIFRAGHNNLSRSLPEDIYNATKLEELALPFNSLNGAISERIANLAHLIILELNSNHLNGALPLNFRKLSKLKFMNLISTAYRNLRVLSLAGCGFNGQILGWLSNLQNLEVLDLGYNQIIGNAKWICRFSNSQEPYRLLHWWKWNS